MEVSYEGAKERVVRCRRKSCESYEFFRRIIKDKKVSGQYLGGGEVKRCLVNRGKQVADMCPDRSTGDCCVGHGAVGLAAAVVASDCPAVMMAFEHVCCGVVWSVCFSMHVGVLYRGRYPVVLLLLLQLFTPHSHHSRNTTTHTTITQVHRCFFLFAKLSVKPCHCQGTLGLLSGVKSFTAMYPM